MTEMFQTPENKSGKTFSLDTVQKTDFTPTCTAVEISELHTPEESGMFVIWKERECLGIFRGSSVVVCLLLETVSSLSLGRLHVLR